MRKKSHFKKMTMRLYSPGVDTTFFLVVERADDFPGTEVIAK